MEFQCGMYALPLFSQSSVTHFGVWKRVPEADRLPTGFVEGIP